MSNQKDKQVTIRMVAALKRTGEFTENEIFDAAHHLLGYTNLNEINETLKAADAYNEEQEFQDELEEDVPRVGDIGNNPDI